MEKNIVIVHYNTPAMTECLLKSIRKHVDGSRVHIFDNSDREPWMDSSVELIDNTKGQIIDFDAWIGSIPGSLGSIGSVNGHVSARHCYSIQKCIDMIGEPFVLLDSDVLLKCDISELYDASLMWSGEVKQQPGCSVMRILPFICWLNVDMMKDKGVRYFNQDWMHGLCRGKEGDYYDTGASFYKEAKTYPHGEFKFSDYVVHYGHGSWVKDGHMYSETSEEWLKRNSMYW